MKKETLFLLMALGLFFSKIWSANYKGHVFEEETNKPAVGITIENQHGKIIAVSDANGFFEFSSEEKSKIILTFKGVGFETTSVNIDPKNSKEIQVILRPKINLLTDVVVTTSRKERLTKNEPVITHIITSKQIEKVAAGSFEDALTALLPGIQFETPRGTTGANRSINLQGLGGSYIMFLIDGEPLLGKNGENARNMRSGQVDFSRIDFNTIERIEYLPSGGSILHGSNSIGGVINIITKHIKKPFQLQVGSRMLFPYQSRYELNGGSAWGKGDIRVGASYTKNKEYTAFENTTKNQEGKEVTNPVIFPGSDAVTTSVNATIFPSEKIKIRSGANFTHSNVFLNASQRSSNEILEKASSVSAGFRLGALFQITKNQSIDVSSSLDFSKQDAFFFNTLQNSREVQLNNKNYLYNLRTQYTIDHNDHHSTIVGLENSHEKSENFWLKNNNGEKQNVTVAYAQHDAKFFNKTLFLSYGLRYDYTSSFGGHFLQRASLLQKIGEFDVRLLYSESFRSPTLSELYTFQEDPQGRGSFYGNPNLKPETSRRYTFQTGYANKNISISASTYLLQVSNVIETPQFIDPTTRKISYTPENFDKNIRIFGGELVAKGQLNNGMYWQGSFSALNSIDRVIHDLKGNKYNTSLRRPYSGTFTIGHSFSRKNYTIDASLSSRYMSKVSYWRRKSLNDANTYSSEIKMKVTDPQRGNTYYNVVEDAYSNVRLATSVKLYNAYWLQFGIDNLLNYRPNQSNYTSALTNGRNYFAAVTIDIDKIKFN